MSIDGVTDDVVLQDVHECTKRVVDELPGLHGAVASQFPSTDTIFFLSLMEDDESEDGFDGHIYNKTQKKIYRFHFCDDASRGRELKLQHQQREELTTRDVLGLPIIELL